MAVENKKTKNDKFVGSVKVGPKGQIVIPKEAREMLNISTGDTLVLLADAKQGIAVQKYEVYEDFFEQVFNAGQSIKAVLKIAPLFFSKTFCKKVRKVILFY